MFLQHVFGMETEVPSDAYNQVQVAENGIALGTANVGGSLDFKIGSYTGDAGNWVTLPASSDFGFGTGDFTIEMFVILKRRTIMVFLWIPDQKTVLLLMIF